VRVERECMAIQKVTAAGGAGGVGSPETVNRDMDVIASMLQMTEEQKGQFRPMLTEAAKKINEINSDANLTPEAKAARLRVVQQQMMKHFSAMLSGAQNETLKEQRGGVWTRVLGLPEAGAFK